MPDDTITNLKVSMGKLETKVDNIESGVARIEETLANYIEKAESKYAGKWVEKTAIGIVIAVVGVILRLIFK